MPLLALNFLGSAQATLGGRPITTFRSTKVRGLLAYLALTSPQPHPREALAALFWPEVADGVARRNLRQSVYQLRRVLGETDGRRSPFLLVTRSTVQFNPASDHALDVAAFLAHLASEDLEQAAAVYAGDLLPAFTCDSLPFEAWLRVERERLHRLALEALFELAARSLARGEYRAGHDFAQRQLSLEPWREEAHRQSMQALALLGERSAALAQYTACRAALEEELGVEPSRETEALMARIRDQRLDGDERSRASDPSERRRLTTPFVGRGGEYGALVKAYQQACGGGTQVAALVGEAGIGKTRLARRFLRWAVTQGAEVLPGQAFETSRRLSYQPLTQVMRRRLEHENAPEDLLSDSWLTQLTRLLPELRDRYPDLPEPIQEEAAARQHLFEAIARLGLALAERSPLVLFIDDWHWADSASLDVLHYALLRWSEERAPILVLLTLRREALTDSPELQAWLTRLKHDAACQQLDLASLSGAETEELIRALLEQRADGDGRPASESGGPSRFAEFCRWLFDETDGQPLFLSEMLKAMVEEGLLRPDPKSRAWLADWSKLESLVRESGSGVLPGVEEIIRGWLHRVSPSAADLLTAASVLGQEASFDLLRRVAGLEEAEALTGLDELSTRGLLVEAEGPLAGPGREPAYSFSHQKMAEFVYAEAGAARRRILHRRAFDALRDTDAPAAGLAHHALHGGLRTEAIRYSMAAGGEAMRLLAVRVALAHLETAWQLAEQQAWPEAISGADRQGLYASLGRAYELTEAWPRARETYQDMVAYAQANGAAAVECVALNRLATVYINGFSDPAQAVVVLEQAREVARRSGDRRGLAETAWNLSLAARMAQDIRRARDHGEEALAIARELGHPQLLARCLNSLAYVHGYLRQWDTVEAYASEARDIYAAAGNRILEADCLRMAGWSQMYSGRPRESLATLRETFAFSQEIENQWGEAECAWRLASTLLDLGRYGEALRLATQAVRQVRVVGVPTMVVLALSTLGRVQRTMMALESARETLQEALEVSGQKDLTGFGDWAPAEMCALHASAGDWRQAHAFARLAMRSREDESLLPMGLTKWHETEALLRGGDADLAQAEVERLGTMVGENPRFRLLWLRSLAVLSRWEGKAGPAVLHLEAAAALAREIDLPGEAWSTLDALAELYTGQGNLAKARRAREEAAGFVQGLAESIGEADLRARFLAAGPVSSILEGQGRA